MLAVVRSARVGARWASYSKRVGIVGAGGVGTAVARNLDRAGIKVTHFTDAYPNAGTALAAMGAQRVATPREVGENCDVVITALTTPQVVKSCVLGDNGVLQGLKPGGLWVDHSTTDYEQMLELAKVCDRAGQRMLEAPITGGLTLLMDGKMTVYVGGDKQVFEEHRPLFEPSFSTILHMGDMGAASITKVVTNMLAGAHLVVAGEALLIAKKAGIDLKAYFDAVRTSAGNSYVWETEVPLAFNQTFDPGFHIDLHCKDWRLGAHIMQKFDCPSETFALVSGRYHRTMYKYGPTVGSSAPLRLEQEDAGTTFAYPGFKHWTYTTAPVRPEGAVEVAGMGVVHQLDEQRATASKLDVRPCDRK